MLSALLAGAVTGAAGAQPATGTPCVDVQIGNVPSYGCLNAQIARAIPPRRFGAASEQPQPATVSAPAAGSFNSSAAAEQLGTSFGHGTKAQRPVTTPPSNPLLPQR